MSASGSAGLSWAVLVNIARARSDPGRKGGREEEIFLQQTAAWFLPYYGRWRAQFVSTGQEEGRVNSAGGHLPASRQDLDSRRWLSCGCPVRGCPVRGCPLKGVGKCSLGTPPYLGKPDKTCPWVPAPHCCWARAVCLGSPLACRTWEMPREEMTLLCSCISHPHRDNANEFGVSPTASSVNLPVAEKDGGCCWAAAAPALGTETCWVWGTLKFTS